MPAYTNKFIIHLFVFSLILGGIAYSLTFFLPGKYFSPILALQFLFFFSATVIAFNHLVKSTENKFNRFVNRFMAATFVKLMIYLAVLIAYVFAHKEDAVPFILSFFILYLAFTIFEVVALLKIFRHEKK